MLKEGLEFDAQTTGHLRDAHDRPATRVWEGIFLSCHGGVATMDVSDGLVDDLCKVSGVGALTYLDLVLADGFLRDAVPSDWLPITLSGGEDYELLLTAPKDVKNRVANTLAVSVSVVGDIVEGPLEVKVLDREGTVMPVECGGWDHFARKLLATICLSDSRNGSG